MGSGVWSSRRWAWLVALLLVVVAVSAESVGTPGETDEDFSTAYGEWPARIRPYVEIVEAERGLAFLHPVPVRFPSAADFRRRVTAEEDELTDRQREEIEQNTGLLRAAGLIEGELDLFEASNDLAGAGIIGFYSFKDQRISLRGSTLGPAARATLVHELTHALQDQHFDIGKRADRLEDKKDTSADEAFDAVVEGDASRIETAYVESLSDEERDALVEEQTAEAGENKKNVVGVPKILQTFVGAPYALGEVMLQLAVEMDGNDAVDGLFGKPPTTQEHLFDPWTVLEDRENARDVDTPRLEPGEERFDSGPFGSLTWYVLLAERIPVLDAFDAADGWGGDSYVAFEREGVTCLRAHYVGDSARDRAQMHDALTDWIAALPGAPASVRRVGRMLRFESCDPGPAADVGANASNVALRLALSRTYLSLGLFTATGDEAFSQCLADRALHGLKRKQLFDPEFAAEDPEEQALIESFVSDCS